MPSTMTNLAQELKDSRNYLLDKLPQEFRNPQAAIICGSGLSGIGDSLVNPVSIAYADIPNFPSQASVPGHKHYLKVGFLDGLVCIVFLGRFHAYEGHEAHATTRIVRLVADMGIPNLIITNAAGSLNIEKCRVGDIMVVEDHISFPSMAGLNPLVGPNLDDYGPRFPALHGCYDCRTYEMVKMAAEAVNLSLDIVKRGIYVHLGGPTYETPAEIAFLRAIGGAAVGMSTVPEVIIAAHCRKVIKSTMVLSLITNEPASSVETAPTHEEVIAHATVRSADLQKLVKALVPLVVKSSE